MNNQPKQIVTCFQEGDVVMAIITAQGLKKDSYYNVAKVIVIADTLIGRTVSYVVSDGEEEFVIINGHLLLTGLVPSRIDATMKSIRQMDR